MNFKTRNSLITILIYGLFVSGILIPGVNAHSPTVAPLYDSDTETLTVYITHSTDDRQSHYIYLVEIYLNGSISETNNYDSQPTNDLFSYEYDVIANNGTTIKAIAYCIVSGSNSAEITVGEGEDPGDGDPGEGESNTIALSAAPFVLFSIIGIFFLTRSQKIH